MRNGRRWGKNTSACFQPLQHFFSLSFSFSPPPPPLKIRQAVDSWPVFLVGRNAIILTVLLGVSARLDSKLTAVTLAAAQTALLYLSQRAACEAVLVGFVGSGSYYMRTQAFIDRVVAASEWPVSAVAAAGSGSGGGIGVGVPPAPALAAAASVYFSPHPYHASFSSDSEARACVAVMTELQVVAALLLVAFGTKPKPVEKEVEEDDSGARRRRRLARRGRTTTSSSSSSSSRSSSSSSSSGRRLRLFRRWAFFLVASAGVLRVTWSFLRSGGRERGVGGISCDLELDRSPPGWSIGGSSSGDPVSEGLSLAGKLRHVFSRGVFAP